MDHTCALLDTRAPLEGECHAWGYAQREPEVTTPTGSPASFHFEGVEGDDYLRLKAGQASASSPDQTPAGWKTSSMN